MGEVLTSAQLAREVGLAAARDLEITLPQRFYVKSGDVTYPVFELKELPKASLLPFPLFGLSFSTVLMAYRTFLVELVAEAFHCDESLAEAGVPVFAPDPEYQPSLAKRRRAVRDRIENATYAEVVGLYDELLKVEIHAPGAPVPLRDVCFWLAIQQTIRGVQAETAYRFIDTQLDRPFPAPLHPNSQLLRADFPWLFGVVDTIIAQCLFIDHTVRTRWKTRADPSAE